MSDYMLGAADGRVKTLERGPAALGARLLALILLLFVAAACGAPQTPAPVIIDQAQTTPSTPPPRNQAAWVRPDYMGPIEPVRVALLLPLGAEQADIRHLAQAMLNAAEMALFDQNNPALLLIPEDTLGSAEGARRAARNAIDKGAEIILGPLFAPSVNAVAAIARPNRIPVIAFSTDRTVAGDGVYLLSFQPETEVDAIIHYAISQGRTRLAALIPYGAYGDRVNDAFKASVAKYHGEVVQTEYYPREAQAMFEPVKRLTAHAQRLAAIEREKQKLREAGDEASLQALRRLEEDGAMWGGMNYDAVLLPEEGNLLRSLAPLLPYYDVDPRQVKFLGTGLWDNPDIAREPSLQGGWFPAPPPQARQAFASRYRTAYGQAPPRIASLAYDAVMLAAILADAPPGRRFTAERISTPNGFYGVDGLFRFLPGGHTERGLAIIEITSEGFKVIKPAPSTFEQTGL